MILTEILCEEVADPAAWYLCSTGDWNCASVDADVLRRIRPKYLKDTPVVYVLFAQSSIYGGKSGLTKRVRTQVMTKYNNTKRAVLIWNNNVFSDEGVQEHIESALMQAFLVCGRPISNRALGIRARDSAGMRQAEKFIDNVLINKASPIRFALGFDEKWTGKAIRTVADTLRMACDCTQRSR